MGSNIFQWDFVMEFSWDLTGFNVISWDLNGMYKHEK